MKELRIFLKPLRTPCFYSVLTVTAGDLNRLSLVRAVGSNADSSEFQRAAVAGGGYLPWEQGYL